MQIDDLLQQALDFVNASSDDRSQVAAVSHALHDGQPVPPLSIALACAILRRNLMTPCTNFDAEQRRQTLMQAVREACGLWPACDESCAG